MTLFDPEELSGEDQASEPASPAEGPWARIAMEVAYDGSGFRGFAAQPRQRTVAGVITAALERVAGMSVRLGCAGRTDAGVHATAQVVHFDLPGHLADPRRLARAVNRQVAPGVVVKAAAVVPPGFDARHSALSRRYRYTIWNASVPAPLLAHTSWWSAPHMDLAAMRAACDPLLGEHDFSAFCRRPPGQVGPIPRRVTDVSWRGSPGGLVTFEIEANAFCHQMVRAVVGTLVRVGQGKLKAADMAAILASGSRTGANQLAPPHGLCLIGVGYDPSPFTAGARL